MKKKGQQQESVEITRITPDYARELLKTNTENRNFKGKVARFYKEEMLAGRWEFNGDTIRISTEGKLLNGQHTLWAVAESGVTIRTVIVRGLAKSTIHTMDCGARRTSADSFGIQGEKCATLLAATLTLIHKYENARVVSTDKYSTGLLEEVLKRHPGVRQAVQQTGSQKVRFIPGSVLAACYYLFSQKDAVLADAFFDNVISGANLTETDPIYVLRERLLNNMAQKWRATPPYIMAITIKAWNSMRKSKPMRALAWRESGESPEPFPIIE